MDNAFQYTADKGIEASKDYEYTGEDGRCKFVDKNVVFKNTGYQDVKENDNEGLKAAVAR